MRKNEERNIEIFKYVLDGYTYKEAGTIFHISDERVRQIISKIKRRIEHRFETKTYKTIYDMRKDKNRLKLLYHLIRYYCSNSELELTEIPIRLYFLTSSSILQHHILVPD